MAIEYNQSNIVDFFGNCKIVRCIQKLANKICLGVLAQMTENFQGGKYMVKMSLTLNIVKDISDWIFNAIGTLLYNTIGRIIILLLDWMQSMFRGLAGLEGMKINGQAVNGEGQESYDLAYWLISTDIIMDIFWSMVLFSAFLLIIMTILAIIRNTYEEKQKPVWDIISSSFKGLLGFIIVPAFAVLGLMFSNVILRAVDAGTSFGNSTKMSTNLFMSAAYDANKLRQDDIDDCRKAFKSIVDETNFEEYEDVGTYYAQVDTLTMDDFDLLATKLDDAFTAEKIKNNNGWILTPATAINVGKCYNVFNINYIVLLAGGCTLIGVFFKMCWGMISRIFKLCFDFVLIPVVNAMMPFDNGNAMKSWKGDFVKNVTMAYGTVGAVNLYFSILPIVNNIEFNNGGVQSLGLFGSLFRLIISIVGVFSANGIIKTVNGWFGVGDVLAEGENALKTFQGGMKSIKGGFGAKDKIKKGLKAGMNIHGAYLGGRQAAGKAGANKFLGGLKGAFGQTGLGKGMSELSLAKNVNEGRKKGAETYNNARLYRGANKDFWHANTDNFDTRQAELDLEKAGGQFSKKYADDIAELNKLKLEADANPGDLDKQEAYKKAKADLDNEMASETFVQQLSKGKAKIKIGDEEKTMQDFDKSVAKREKDLGQAETNQSIVSGYASTSSSVRSNYDVVKSKVNRLKFGQYLRGEIGIESLKLTPDEQSAALAARSDYQRMLNDAIKTLKIIYKNNKNALNGKVINGKTISEEVISQINNSEEARKMLTGMEIAIGDFANVARAMDNANQQEKKDIKVLQEQINEAKAKVAQDIAAGNVAGYTKEYIDGGK